MQTKYGPVILRGCIPMPVPQEKFFVSLPLWQWPEGERLEEAMARAKKIDNLFHRQFARTARMRFAVQDRNIAVSGVPLDAVVSPCQSGDPTDRDAQGRPLRDGAGRAAVYEVTAATTYDAIPVLP